MKTRAVFPPTLDILYVSCPAGLLLTRVFSNARVPSSLCGRVWGGGCVQMCTQTFLETRSYKLAEEGGGLSSPSLPAELYQFGTVPWSGSSSHAFGDGLELFSLKTQAGWGLSSLPLRETWLFPASQFSCTHGSHVFPSSSPRRGPQVSFPVSDLPSSSLCCLSTLCLAQQPTCSPGLSSALVLLLPFQLFLLIASNLGGKKKIHHFSKPSSHANKGQILRFFLQGLPLYSSIFLSFFLSIPSSSADFSFLPPHLLHAGIWTELRIMNVCLEKPYLTQNKHKNPWAGLRLFLKLFFFKQLPTR